MSTITRVRPPHRKRTRRAVLWRQQDGLCYWCRQPTILLEPVPKRKEYPSDMATLDHLRSRLNPTRQEPAKNKQRLVMACWACNNARGVEEEKALPIEVLRQRSWNGRRSESEIELSEKGGVYAN